MRENQMIAVLSDSHDNRTATQQALKQISELGIRSIIHCGDICAPYMLELFDGFDARFVFGNNDWDEAALKAKAEELGFELADSLELELEQRRILVCHGHRELLLDHALESQSFDYIFRGHSHAQQDEMVGKTRLINPGALYRAKEYSFVTLDIESDELRFYEVGK